MSNHGKDKDVNGKSWLNTLKDKVAKCTCQIMNTLEYVKSWLNTLKDKVS